MDAIEITNTKLIICSISVILVSISTFLLKIKVAQNILISAFRAVAQLFLVGLILKELFKMDNIYLVMLTAIWMIFWAAITINGRIKNRPTSIFWPALFSMFICSLSITLFATTFIIQTDPLKAQYFIPILGMILGNAMNGITLSINHLLNNLKIKRYEINQYLFLGATYKEATQLIFADSIRAGLIPIINTLMSVGLVTLPGMMTGQILAGADPLNAIKYQIIVMFLILAAITFGSIITTYMIRAKCFTHDDVLSENLFRK